VGAGSWRAVGGHHTFITDILCGEVGNRTVVRVRHGPDALWFAENGGDKIGRLPASTVLTASHD
jgi:hypothetical protein